MNRQQKKAWLQQAWALGRTVEYCRLVRKGHTAGDIQGVDCLLAQEEMKKAAAMLGKRKAAITGLKDGGQKKVLWLRYICHYSWRDIEKALGYSRRSLFYIHNKGVEGIKVGQRWE